MDAAQSSTAGQVHPGAGSGGGSDAVCSQCARPIVESYFLSAGQTWCPACTAQGRLQTVARGCRPLLLASLFGALAAAAAAGIWALIVIWTGYQLGLVAVVIGILVGLAVRKGSGGSGGRRYQVLAMALTLAALAYASVPIAIAAIRDDPDLSRKFKEMWTQASGRSAAVPARQEPAASAVRVDGEDAAVGAAPAATIDTPGAPPAAAEAPLTTPPAPAAGTAPTAAIPAAPGKAIGMALLGLLVLAGAALFGPFVLYVLLLVSDPFSLIFLGIALWEAWRFTRPPDRVFEGPFKACEEPIDFTQAQT
jgi:hypothetical protein